MNFFVSIFDIIGSIMTGPSSSHTAGVAVLRYESFRKIGDVSDNVEIKHYNSFSDMGKGHNTDVASVLDVVNLFSLTYEKGSYRWLW